MDEKVPSAAGTVVAMMSWRIDLLERALATAAEANTGCQGLADAARAVRGLKVTEALAQRLLEEGYEARCAEEQAEREAAARSRSGLHVLRASG